VRKKKRVEGREERERRKGTNRGWREKKGKKRTQQ